MGSQAQDNRHEQLLLNAKQKVLDIENKISDKQLELKKLENDLKNAKERLEQQEHIDIIRD